jgi:hypothetical protein
MSNPICSTEKMSRGFTFAVIGAIILYYCILFLIGVIVNAVNDLPRQTNFVDNVYNFAGIVVIGYDAIDIQTIFVIFIIIGLFIGASNGSILLSLVADVLFIILQFIVFFGIGLLYLGNHYVYEDMFNNLTVTLVIPFITLCVSSIIGSFLLKKPPKYITQIARI